MHDLWSSTLKLSAFCQISVHFVRMFDNEIFNINLIALEEETVNESEEAVTSKINEIEFESGILTFPEIIYQIKPKLCKIRESVHEIRFHPEFKIKNLDAVDFSMFINLEKINIPKNVKKICFKGCKKLHSVVFETNSQLEKLCDSAFYECELLKSIDLPRSLQTIEKHSFSKSGITRLDLGETQCKTIGNGAFEDCLMLESVVMPNGIEVISNSLFKNCHQLKTVEFRDNNSLLTIEEKAFFACSSLSSIKIPPSVQNIHSYAFKRSGLVEIIFNESLTSIGWECFAECKDLKAVHVPKLLKILQYESFNSCTSLCSVTFDEDSELEKIESFCFKNTSIESIIFPKSLRKIDGAAFKQTKLKQVNFSDDSKLEVIGYSAFESGIDKIILPPNLKCICVDSFDKSTHLDWSKCKYLVKSPSGTIINRSMKRIISVPSSLKHFIIPESVALLDMGLFQGTQIEWINIPSSVERIIQSNDIPGGSINRITFSKDSKLKEIGSRVFRNLSLSRISIPSSVEKINYKAFQDSSFVRIHFQEKSKLKEFVSVLFYFCYITRIDIPSSVEIIRRNAFEYCDLEVIKFSIDSKLKKINYHAFFECKRIKSINLENCKQLEMVEPEAFDEQVFELIGIKPFVPMKIDEDGQLVQFDHDAINVEIPDDVVSIGPKIFFNEKVARIKFNKTSSLKTIGKYSFSLTVLNSFEKELKSIVFPPSLELIEEYAFCGCMFLEKISFMEGSKLKRIKTHSFMLCEQLRCIELPDHEIVIENYAFDSYVEPKSQNIIWENIKYEIDDDHYEEEDGEELEFDSPIIVIPASVEKILDITNKQKTTKITYEEGSKLKEINYMLFNEEIDIFLPPSVEKIKYYSFNTLKSLNIMNNNFKTSDEGIVTSFCPRAILFVPPNVESIDIDPDLEIIFSYAFCKSRIKSISLPATMKIIGKGAFLDSELEKIDFAEGTELDILDSQSLLARNLKYIKMPRLKEITGFSIVVKDFRKIEFPMNFCPKNDMCYNFIEYGWPDREILGKQEIILPFSSIEFIFKAGIAEKVKNYLDSLQVEMFEYIIHVILIILK